MERRTIKIPDASTHDQMRPKRAYRVTPTGPLRPEIVRAREPAGKIQQIEQQPEKSTQKMKKTRVPFEQRYSRVTTYFRKDLLQTAWHLQEEGLVNSFTALVNDVLQDYVQSNHQNHLL